MKRRSPNVIYLGDRVPVILTAHEPGSFRRVDEVAEVVEVGALVAVKAPSLPHPATTTFGDLLAQARGFDG